MQPLSFDDFFPDASQEWHFVNRAVSESDVIPMRYRTRTDAEGRHIDIDPPDSYKTQAFFNRLLIDPSGQRLGLLGLRIYSGATLSFRAPFFLTFQLHQDRLENAIGGGTTFFGFITEPYTLETMHKSISPMTPSGSSTPSSKFAARLRLEGNGRGLYGEVLLANLILATGIGVTEYDGINGTAFAYARREAP